MRSVKYKTMTKTLNDLYAHCCEKYGLEREEARSMFIALGHKKFYEDKWDHYLASIEELIGKNIEELVTYAKSEWNWDREVTIRYAKLGKHWPLTPERLPYAIQAVRVTAAALGYYPATCPVCGAPTVRHAAWDGLFCFKKGSGYKCTSVAEHPLTYHLTGKEVYDYAI